MRKILVPTDYEKDAHGAVIGGDWLPLHDEVFDLAQVIALTARGLYSHISEARSPEHADAAVRELLQCLARDVDPAEVRFGPDLI